jgi:tetratricopeptide (TPR) repeat protein
LEKKAALLLKTIGGPTVLREHRPTPPPPPEQWWWYMNEMVSAQNQRLMRRLIIGLVIVLLIIGAVVLAFNTILKPSEEVVVRINTENDANYAVEDGNYDEALTIIEEGLAKVPDDPGLLLFKGVLHQVLGDEELAEQTFVQVQEILDDPVSFHLARAQLYLRVNQLEWAEAEALIALELDEDFARTWLTLGQALEFQGKVLEAVEAYEKAGKFAFDNNENEVYVLSRMAIARLSQIPPPLPVEEATEESETPSP